MVIVEGFPLVYNDRALFGLVIMTPVGLGLYSLQSLSQVGEVRYHEDDDDEDSVFDCLHVISTDH